MNKKRIKLFKIGKFIQEKKDKILNEILIISSNNKNCQTEEEFEQKLYINCFSSEVQDYINNDQKASIYYMQQKEIALNQFLLRLQTKKKEQEIKNERYENKLYANQLQDMINQNNEKIRELEEKNYNDMINMQNKLNFEQQKKEEEIKQNKEQLFFHMNNLRQMQEKNQTEIERRDAMLNQIISEYNKKMDIMEENTKKAKKEYEEKQKLSEEKHRKLIEDLENKIKKEKDEQKRQELIKEKELTKKKENIKNEFNKKVESLINEKINEFLKNFEKEKNNFCIYYK